jgi:hypothetical protein
VLRSDRPRHYLQTLDKVGEACQGLSSLLRKFVNYGLKKFDDIGAWGKCFKTFTAVSYEYLK